MIKISKRFLWAFVVSSCICALTAIYLLRKPSYKSLGEIAGFIEGKSHFIPVKITAFSPCNSPQIAVTIEDHTISSDIDLGWRGDIALLPTILYQLHNKRYIGRYPSSGLTGKIYESDLYELPQIHLGKMKIFPAKAKEQNLEFLEDTLLQKGDPDFAPKHEGKVGWNLFKNFNLLLDCEHSMIALCDSLLTLKDQGFSIDSFIEAPLLLDRDLLDFQVMTEAGSLRCTLDTGSTWNLLNKDMENSHQDHRIIDLVHKKVPTCNPQNENLLIFDPKDRWEAKTFQINGNEFGPVHFRKIKSPLDFDAIVGMKFIEEHLIFIDFYKKKIYFSKLPEERSPLIRAYEFLEDIHKWIQKLGIWQEGCLDFAVWNEHHCQRQGANKDPKYKP